MLFVLLAPECAANQFAGSYPLSGEHINASRQGLLAFPLGLTEEMAAR